VVARFFEMAVMASLQMRMASVQMRMASVQMRMASVQMRMVLVSVPMAKIGTSYRKKDDSSGKNSAKIYYMLRDRKIGVLLRWR